MYVPGVDTVIDGEVDPLLHNNVPANDPAVNTELVQLLTTLIVGGSTTSLNGAAVAPPLVLVHPLIVCLTVYNPASLTVIAEVVAPLLHNNEPVNPDAVNTELPQLLATLTDGATGVVFGEAVTLLAILVHPFTVWVTVYIPGLFTVIDAVVSVVLHNNDPAKFDAVKVELSQLFATSTVGASGIIFGAAMALAGALPHPLTIWVNV